MKRLTIILVIAAICSSLHAETADSTKATPKGVLGWLEKYLSETNQPKPEKAFDFSIIGGPHYSSDTKFGIGLVAAGLYRHDRADSLLQPSNISLYGDISTAGFYMLGIRGTHFFPQDRFRIDYKTYFYSFLTHFWGMGYGMGIDNDNKSKYQHLQSKVEIDFLARVAPSFYIGPKVEFQYVKARKVRNPELWGTEALRTTNFSAGFTMSYDTRDCETAAQKGVRVMVEQLFFPRGMGNHEYNFSMTEFTASHYTGLWKGAVLATQIHGRFTYGNTPWGMLSTLGGSNNMRGYYDGRFRDKNEADIVAELRQHIYGRSGAVAWIGAGNVFPDFSGFRLRHTLPNFGIGYRWEFKHRMNVRLEIGRAHV